MKFERLPECVQRIAAVALAERISIGIAWSSENKKRTEEAKEIAKTVRDCFIELYEDAAVTGSGLAGEDSGVGV